MRCVTVHMPSTISTGVTIYEYTTEVSTSPESGMCTTCYRA